MKSPFNQLVVFTILMLSILSSAVTAAMLDDENVIWKSGYQYLRYQPLDSENFGRNDHPVDLNPEMIATVLKGLEFRAEDSLFATDDDREPVFALTEASRLGEMLARGLRNARPDQDIVFVLQKSVSKLILLEDQVMTSGRAFYKDGKLNIIIGEYERTRNKEFERVYDSSGQVSPYKLSHGFRSKSMGRVKQNVVNIAGVSNKILNNDLRQDWFVIDVQEAFAALQQQRQAKESGNGIDTEAARQMRLEAARMKKEQRELKLEMARMREQMKSMNGSGSAGGKTVEERMATLDKLRDEGLISDEEYAAKREEILGDI